MGRDERQLRRMRGEALSRLLQGLTYGGCLVIFYALMAIPNWPAREASAAGGRAVHGCAHHGRGDVFAIADYERQPQ